jgi:hypothetical protein
MNDLGVIVCNYCSKRITSRSGNLHSRSLYAHYTTCREYSLQKSRSALRVPSAHSNYNRSDDDIPILRNHSEDEGSFRDEGLPDHSEDEGSMGLPDHSEDEGSMGLPHYFEDEGPRGLPNDYNGEEPIIPQIDTYVFVKPTQTNVQYLLYQMNIFGKIVHDAEAPFRTGWLKKGTDGSKSDWEDYVILNKFVISSRLSIRNGDKLLETIATLCSRHNVSLNLPSTYKCVRRALERSMSQDYKFFDVEIPYLKDLFTPENYAKVLHPVGAYLDPVEVIAEFLLSIDEEDLIVRKEVNYDKQGRRILNSFTSSYAFEQLCDSIKEDYGEDVYPICIDMNVDLMPITAKRSLTPIKIRVKNLSKKIRSKESCVMNVGFTPVPRHTDEELEDLLQDSIPNQGNRKDAIPFFKR